MADSDGLLSSFTEEREFFDLLGQFLHQTEDRTAPLQPDPEDTPKSIDPLSQLTRILDGYQEQPYLLDPHLERMVQPVVQNLRHWVEYLQREQANSPTHSGGVTDGKMCAEAEKISYRVQRVSRLLYFITKVRGYKTIVRFFPHEVPDLSVVLATFCLAFHGPPLESTSATDFVEAQSWEFRYILLLWLSLICMIPFDLSRFDQLPFQQERCLKTSQNIENIGWSFLNLPGKEREASALVLARLMLREDVSSSRLLPFVDKCLGNLQQAEECGVFLATGIVQFMCILVKLARPLQLVDVLPSFTRALSDIDRLPYMANNISLRKLRTKLAGRIATISLLNSRGFSTNEGFQVSESIDTTIQELLERLQDKDTIVRWSAAKYLAKIGKHLPAGFSDQICDAFLELFTLKTVKQQEGDKLDLLAVSECTWHGACLACAEFLRRKLFPLSRVGVLIQWTVRALHFEQRKGIQNIGAGVRDAAAYVLWSFARAFSPADVNAHGNQLAIQLVLQSLFDREVHIRRAGSAAFQENVGRLGIFPHGIDVLQRADFFTVGLRRSAFLNAAPDVARFDEYQEAILNHLIGVCVRHWDADIRELASQSICEIARGAIDRLPRLLLDRFALDIHSKDTNQTHGTLLTLAELAKVLPDDPSRQDTAKLRCKIFELIKSLPNSYLKSYNSDLLVIAICQGLTHTLPASFESCQEFSESAYWGDIINVCLKRPNDAIHRSIQQVIHQLSIRGAGKQHLQIFAKNLRTGRFIARQASARCLGGFVFRTEPLQKPFKPIFELLATYAVQMELTTAVTIEVTRNALESLVSIVINLGDEVEAMCTHEQFSQLVSIVLGGLKNYTNDQRGDVGSWVRASSLGSLAELVEFCAVAPSRVQRYLSQGIVHSIIAGALKQALDSIDALRELAWKTLSRVIFRASSQLTSTITIEGLTRLSEIFDQQHSQRWRELGWTFPMLLKLFDLLGLGPDPSQIPAGQAGLESYRDAIIEGIVLLIGGRGNSDAKKAGELFVDHVCHAKTQNPSAVEGVVTRILDLARGRTKGQKLVLSCWETLSLLFEANALDYLGDTEHGRKLLQGALIMVTHGLDRPKYPMSRILAGMKIVVNLTRFKCIRMEAASCLKGYISHGSPRVRAMTAEALSTRLQLQGGGSLEAHKLLTETAWSDCRAEDAVTAATEVIRILQDEWVTEG